MHEIAPLSIMSSCESDNFRLMDESAAGSCPLCHSFMDRPLELKCGSTVCLQCCCERVEINDNRSCPICDSHDLSALTIKAPTETFCQLLGSVRVQCVKCSTVTTAKDATTHSCHSQYSCVSSPSRLSVRDILDRPMDSSLHPLEKRVTVHLLKRMMATSSSSIVTVPTQRRVSRYYYHYIRTSNK